MVEMVQHAIHIVYTVFSDLFNSGIIYRIPQLLGKDADSDIQQLPIQRTR